MLNATHLDGLLGQLIDHAEIYASLWESPDVAVASIITISEYARVRPDGHVYNDPYVLVQLECGARGAVFCHPEDLIHDVSKLIGMPPLDALRCAPDYVRVAILDAMFAVLGGSESAEPDAIFELTGNAAARSRDRASKLVELLDVNSKTKVAVIGVIEDVIVQLRDAGAEVRLFDHYLAGEEINGIQVSRDIGSDYDWPDALLVTGNTLKTQTLESILKNCRERDIRLMIYAMTGANIAPRYVQMGADVVTCEKFPFYWFSGLQTTMEIYKRKPGG